MRPRAVHAAARTRGAGGRRALRAVCQWRQVYVHVLLLVHMLLCMSVCASETYACEWCGSSDNPVENMGPGRYMPVVYQAPTERDDRSRHHERRWSVEKNAPPQKKKTLEAMLVRVCFSGLLVCQLSNVCACAYIPYAVVGTHPVVHEAERKARPLHHVQRAVRTTVSSAHGKLSLSKPFDWWQSHTAPTRYRSGPRSSDWWRRAAAS